jgi:excisionase family DNA binding protein
MDPKFLTVTEAAKILDLSSDSIRRYEREGILLAIRVGSLRRKSSGYASNDKRNKTTRGANKKPPNVATPRLEPGRCERKGTR